MQSCFWSYYANFSYLSKKIKTEPKKFLPPTKALNIKFPTTLLICFANSLACNLQELKWWMRYLMTLFMSEVFNGLSNWQESITPGKKKKKRIIWAFSFQQQWEKPYWRSWTFISTHILQCCHHLIFLKDPFRNLLSSKSSEGNCYPSTWGLQSSVSL